MLEKTKKQIDNWIAKFPAGKKQSAVLAVLRIVQDENGGWLTEELMSQVADYLGMSKIEVYEVATFYTMFDLKPVGKHKIRVCTNISCMLRESEQIAGHLKKKLGIEFGETTSDGKFTLYESECLGSCKLAPMMQIDGVVYGNLTLKKVDDILNGL